MYWAIYYLYIYASWLRQTLQAIGDSLQGVFILGDYLQGWFYALADYVGYLENQLRNTATAWDYFLDWLETRLTLAWELELIKDVAYQLYNFAVNPYGFFIGILNNYFNPLYLFHINPIEYIVSQFETYTGLNRDFISDPFRVVTGWIRDELGDVSNILSDPRAWLDQWLAKIIPDYATLKASAAKWVTARIKEELPALADFIKSPVNFIFDLIIKQVEDIQAANTQKIIKAVETVLNKIF